MGWTLVYPGNTGDSGPEGESYPLSESPVKLPAAHGVYLAPLCFAKIPHDVYLRVDKLDIDPEVDGWPWIVRNEGVFSACMLVDSGPIFMDVPDIHVPEVRLFTSLFYLANQEGKVRKNQSVSSILLVKGHRFPL